MFRKAVTISAVTFLVAGSLLADFSYHETSKITGGIMAGAMKVVGVFSKQAREPIETNVAVKGDRMARRSQTHGEIIDANAETITSIDFQKKTYSVMTFAQMKQMLDDAMNQMKGSKDKNGAEMKWKVSGRPTGNSRTISGHDAKEVVLTMEMEATDQKSGQSGAMVVTTHVWIASGIAGAGEMRDFFKKMAEKLSWTPGGSAMMANPEVAKGMAEAYKEIAKLDGTPVLQTLSMGGPGTAPADGAVPATNQQQESNKPSIGGALGGALGGKFGLGKKKNADAPAQQQQQQQPSGSLIDMTTEYSNFAQSADASLFEVPAGFKKVEPEMRRK